MTGKPSSSLIHSRGIERLTYCSLSHPLVLASLILLMSSQVTSFTLIWLSHKTHLLASKTFTKHSPGTKVTIYGYLESLMLVSTDHTLHGRFISGTCSRKCITIQIRSFHSKVSWLETAWRISIRTQMCGILRLFLIWILSRPLFYKRLRLKIVYGSGTSSMMTLILTLMPQSVMITWRLLTNSFHASINMISIELTMIFLVIHQAHHRKLTDSVWLVVRILPIKEVQL